MVTTDMIIWFKSIHGSTYYLGKGFIPIRVTKDITLAEVEEKAKRYSSKSVKRIFHLLEKKYFNEIGDINTGSLSLHIKKYYVFEKNNVKYINF